MSLWNRDKQSSTAAFQPQREWRAHYSMAENDVCNNGTRFSSFVAGTIQSCDRRDYVVTTGLT